VTDPPLEARIGRMAVDFRAVRKVEPNYVLDQEVVEICAVQWPSRI